MKPRIYTDTLVLGGCEDEEFREPSRRLVDAFVAGELILVVSELTLSELAAAPEAVMKTVARVPEAYIETVAVSGEAEELADAYVQEGAVGASMLADALHMRLLEVT